MLQVQVQRKTRPAREDEPEVHPKTGSAVSDRAAEFLARTGDQAAGEDSVT